MSRTVYPIQLILLLALLCITTAGCKPYVIEYRTRPSYYDQMSTSSFENGVTRDGVEIRWVEPEQTAPDSFDQKISGEVFRIREEQEDGTVTLRAKMPKHVLINTLACLRNNEYQLLWDQMLAPSTQSFYMEQEDGYEKYEKHLRKHRRDMASFLNRMIVGQTFNEVIIETGADGTTYCYLCNRLRPEFKFREVLIVKEGREFKLQTIR